MFLSHLRVGETILESLDWDSFKVLSRIVSAGPHCMCILASVRLRLIEFSTGWIGVIGDLRDPYGVGKAPNSPIILPTDLGANLHRNTDKQDRE